jgi:hypothetical protein
LKRRADAKLSNPDAGLKAEEVGVMSFLSRTLERENADPRDSGKSRRSAA